MRRGLFLSFIDPPPCPSDTSECVGAGSCSAGIASFRCVAPRKGRGAPRRAWLRAPCLVAVASSILGAASAAEAGHRALKTGWWLQSSARVLEKGDVLSRPGLETEGWQAITVPNTVVGALVEN